MAKYTIELREILQNNINVFSAYPIFDESYRVILETKITDHYYFREIGVETVGRFKKYLQVKMTEIMPYYNKIYVATALKQRILDNYDVTETYTKDGTIGAKGTTTGKHLHSDTPQGRIDISDGKFVSDIQDDAMTDINTGTSTENWARTMRGNIGVQNDSQAVKMYVDMLMNVDLMIIAELNDLFMGVY